MLGLFLIPFSLVMLWKNEKKLVTYARLLGTAKKEFKEVKDVTNPLDEQDLDLVFCTGQTENAQAIPDHEFGISVDNSYRLKRTVEMYQWEETSR